jgi:hypothetical protein
MDSPVHAPVELGILQSLYNSLMQRAISLLAPAALLFLLGSTLCAQQQPQTLPFQLQDNLVRVPVTLNGQAVEAVLDSGTGAIGIDYSFAQSLHLDIGASIGMAPGGGREPEPMYPVILDHLDFGPEHFSYTPAVAVSLGHLSDSAGFPVRMLLGLPVFRADVMRVDYPARTLTFLAAFPPCADPIPFRLYGGDPMIAASVTSAPGAAPRTLHLIVDLGTRRYAAMLGGKFVDSAAGHALQAAGHPTQVGTGTGGAVQGTVASLARLTVGSRSFRNLTIALTHNVGIFEKGVADGTLGVPIWQNGAVTFDYGHKTVCFDLPK